MGRRNHAVRRAIRRVAEGKRELNLHGAKLGDVGASRIAEAIERSSTLRQLSLENCAIGDAGAMRLADALERNKSLAEISLVGNSIGDAGTMRLMAALERTDSIQSLDLAGNPNADAKLCRRRQNLDEIDIDSEWFVDSRPGTPPVTPYSPGTPCSLISNGDAARTGTKTLISALHSTGRPSEVAGWIQSTQLPSSSVITHL